MSSYIRVGREPVGDGPDEQRPVGGVAGEHVSGGRVGRVPHHLVLQLQELLPERQLRHCRRNHLRRHQLSLAFFPVFGCEINKSALLICKLSKKCLHQFQKYNSIPKLLDPCWPKSFVYSFISGIGINTFYSNK